MTYQVRLTRRAVDQLAALPLRVRQRIRERVGSLASDPRPRGSLKLAGEAGLYRICVGDYRVIYAIRDRELLVLVVRVSDRKRAYDRLAGLLGALPDDG